MAANPTKLIDAIHAHFGEKNASSHALKFTASGDAINPTMAAIAT